MNINPTQPNQTRGPAPERPQDTAAVPPPPGERRTGPGAPPPLERPDQVELSEAARRLQEQPGLAPTPSPECEPERLKEILQRVAAGHYDRPEIRDEVLRRLWGDLINDPTET